MNKQIIDAIDSYAQAYIRKIVSMHSYLTFDELYAVWREEDEGTYSNLKLSELQELCKQRGLSSTGTKNDLVKSLLPKKSVLSSINIRSSSVIIKKNKFGNLEHSETGFVFDKDSKRVIGKQRDDGILEELDQNDLELCSKLKFMYSIPRNLDKKIDLADAVIEELDEEYLTEELEEDMEYDDEDDDEDDEHDDE